MGYGNQGHVGIAFQSSYGTANTTSHHFIPFVSESLTEKIPRITAEGMRSIYETGPQFAGFNEFGGDIVTEVHPILIGKLLKGWCGVCSSTLTVSYYTHNFKPRQSAWDTTYAPLPPVSVEIYRDTGSGMLYSDHLVDGFTLDISQGKLLKATWSLIGANAAKTTKQTASYLQGSEFVWNQCSVSLGGSAITDISQLTFKGANALEAIGTLDGTTKPNRIARKGSRTLEISGTMMLNGDTQKDIYRAGTEQRLLVTVTGQAVSSGYNAVLTIDIPSMVYDEFPDNIGGPGLINVNFKASAKYNSGSATMVAFTLVNTLAAY